MALFIIMNKVLVLIIAIFAYSLDNFSQEQEYTEQHDDGTYSIGKRDINGYQQGEWKKYYASGKVFIVANYINDTLEGPVKSYYKNGIIQAENDYIGGKLNGVSKQYDIKGRPIREISYKNNLIYGNCIYYEDGVIYTERYYKNGIVNGPCKDYYENGKLEHEYIQNADGSITNSKCYDRKGKQIKCNFF